MSEMLFRFNVVRDATRTGDEIDAIDLATGSAFQTEAAGFGGQTRRTRLRELARSYIDSELFANNRTITGDLGGLDRLAALLDELLDGQDAVTRADVLPVIETATGSSAETFLSSSGLDDLMTRVADSILAIKLSPTDHGQPIRRLAVLLRTHRTLIDVRDDPSFPADAKALAAALRRPLRVPDAVVPTRERPEPRPERPPLTDRLRKLAERHRALSGALTELRAIRPRDYVTGPSESSPGLLPPEHLRPVRLFETEREIRLAALARIELDAAAILDRGADGGGRTPAGTPDVAARAAAALGSDSLMPVAPAVRLAAGANIALRGRPELKPALQGTLGLRLTETAQRGLSKPTVEMLSDLGLDTAEPVAPSLETLTTARREVHREAQALAAPLAPITYRRVGRGVIGTSSTATRTFRTMSPRGLFELFGDDVEEPAEGVPTSAADIRPTGVMDLMLVRQQLRAYERDEVSHITNILRGESTERIHRTRLEVETITVTESELTTESEHELTTADRFEIRREAETSLQEVTAAKGALQVKGKYGPSVEITASGEASWQRQRTETERATQEVAREVTERASEKVTERTLRRETRRINRQVEETNQHGFDNTTGDRHISGVYQWVTKVYEAQMYNYGPRTVYDIMVPEPGTLLLTSFSRHRNAAVELEEPEPFTLRPDQIDEDTYQDYVVLYRATDVEPPPQAFATESYDFNTGGEDKDQEFTNSTRIKIPDGYRAFQATVGQVVSVWDDWSVDVVIGKRTHRFSGGGWVWPTDLDGETGSIPFAMVTDKVGDVAIAVEVICEATNRAYELWQADTFAKLVHAYHARRSEYEAKLAELEAEAPAEIQSGPALRNRALMLDEVKRQCISIMTEQHFDAFGSVGQGAQDLPEIDFDENFTEGAYVRFFEQAFEWENVSWVPYPYFWANKPRWLERLAISDDDADFEAFLSAGYLRVQIPVRPGFVDALDHFRLFGEPWLGGPLPSISDDQYLPIADELAERLGRPGEERPVGEPWDVRVPTSLVQLRADDQLPIWTKQDDGTWVGS